MTDKLPELNVVKIYRSIFDSETEDELLHIGITRKSVLDREQAIADRLEDFSEQIEKSQEILDNMLLDGQSSQQAYEFAYNMLCVVVESIKEKLQKELRGAK